jgi:hypothetical protein
MDRRVESLLLQQIRQLGDVGRNPPRLILAEQLGRRSPPRLLLEMDIGKPLPSAVTDFESNTDVLDGPGRREAASGMAAYFLCRRSHSRCRGIAIIGYMAGAKRVQQSWMTYLNWTRGFCFDIADEVLERAANAEQSAFTLAFCTSNWDSCGMVD